MPELHAHKKENPRRGLSIPRGLVPCYTEPGNVDGASGFAAIGCEPEWITNIAGGIPELQEYSYYIVGHKATMQPIALGCTLSHPVTPHESRLSENQETNCYERE